MELKNSIPEINWLFVFSYHPMSKKYLEVGHAPDFEDPKRKNLYRFFEIIPGVISLGTLIGVLVFSWILPSFVAIFIILFCFFYLCKICYFSIHQIATYIKMKRNLKTNWQKKLKELKDKDWKDIYHLIVLPTYKEKPEIIKSSLNALIGSDHPKDKMIIVLGLEERAGKEAQERADEIKKEYEDSFYQFLITVHPKDIPGELAGKGSNEKWAVREAKEKIIDKLNIPYKNIIVSSFDIDTKVYPRYFSCLTYHFLTVENPQKTSYQPVPVYNNNIWKAPAFSRLVATSNTFWQMVQQGRSEKLVTYSSHSMPFWIFEEVGYPNNMVSDDSRIFWKSYLYYNGDYKVVPLYYPVSMDAVLADNLWKTIINQYKQQRRWAWGCEEIPYLIYGFLKNKKISLPEKLKHLFTILDGYWSWATSTLLIFILGWLPLILGGEKFSRSLLSYNLPRLTGRIMTLAMIGMIVSAILSMLLLPPRPEETSKTKYLFLLLQWVLLPVTLIVFGSFPALDAQIHLMLGKYMGFWVTEKARK